MDEPSLDWGHAVLTPEEQEIRLPARALGQLRQLGLLKKNRKLGLNQISPMIYELLKSDYNCLTGSLKRLLGEDVLGDMTGPLVVKCPCKGCRFKAKKLKRNNVPDWKAIVDDRKPGLKEF